MTQWCVGVTSPMAQMQNAEVMHTSMETRYSAWTPITMKPSNQRLFQDRLTLILHWFDMWTDDQRKTFLCSIFSRCTKRQLRSMRDKFSMVVPSSQLDFTTVLPRFISLYILSFLNPMELCAASQVCWHWKFLSEQDCLWAPKCIRRAWFLPYTPSRREYGAWKEHYVACACSLDFLTPREAASLYGTLNQPLKDLQEQQDRQLECRIREAIQGKVAEHRRATIRSRRAWLCTSLTPGSFHKESEEYKLRKSMEEDSFIAELVVFGEKSRSRLRLSQLSAEDKMLHSSNSSIVKMTDMTNRTLQIPLRRDMFGSAWFQPSQMPQPALHLLFISSRVPAYELLLSATRVGVVPLLYEHSGTSLEGLLAQAEKRRQSRTAQSVAFVVEGDATEFNLLEGCQVTSDSLLRPDIRNFWEKLSGWVKPAAEGGCLCIFAPLAASNSGMELISHLTTLTGLTINCPAGFATGSYQHILSEWLEGEEFPPHQYFVEEELLNWSQQTEWLKQALEMIREQLGGYLHKMCQEARGRAVGQFLWDLLSPSKLYMKSETTSALSDGLAALSRENGNPLKFLGKFLLQRTEEGTSNSTDSEVPPSNNPDMHLKRITGVAEVSHGSADKRFALLSELLSSEKVYVSLLQAVEKVYFLPLKAALISNQAIISATNIQILFKPLLQILEVSKVFLHGLTERLRERTTIQCVGDLFYKLCSKLKTYTNFLKNYPTILRTIDRCRDTAPSFRAFLKWHDHTPATRMLSLQGLLLLPSTRIEEYTMLIQALVLHTAPDHPDYPQLGSTMESLTNCRSFLIELKKSANGDSKMLELQKVIQSCPNLQEGNRHLIRSQDVVQLTSPDPRIAALVRVYEVVNDLGLFLFNDVLLLAQKRLTHLPFSHAQRKSYIFLTSVALHKLFPMDITDSKYVKNAFVLKCPRRQWICATETEEEKVSWLSLLHTTISAAAEP